MIERRKYTREYKEIAVRLVMEKVMDGICRSLYSQLRNNPQMGLEMENRS